MCTFLAFKVILFRLENQQICNFIEFNACEIMSHKSVNTIAKDSSVSLDDSMEAAFRSQGYKLS